MPQGSILLQLNMHFKLNSLNATAKHYKQWFYDDRNEKILNVQLLKTEHSKVLL